MADPDNNDGYVVFEEDRGRYGYPRREFAPTLRVKVLILAILAALIFWSVIGYVAWGWLYPSP